MQYFATITNENNEPLLRVALRSISCEQRCLAPIRVPAHWETKETLHLSRDDVESIEMKGEIVDRLAGDRPVPEDLRAIYVPAT